MKEVYILSASRTPIGSYGGSLSTVPATQLGSVAIKNAVRIAEISPEAVEAIVMGNVLSASLGQAPARQASKAAGLPDSVCATTVNKVCASGMKAINMIFQDIRQNDISVGIAGGMENMSQVPFYVPDARFGLGYGNRSLVDGLVKDGLTDAYSQTSMGISGDKTAERYEISREELDAYALRSYANSAAAWEKGYFANEISAVEILQRKGNSIIISEDEEYKKVNPEKLRLLRPAFSSEGTMTAANSSPMSDGASALVLVAKEYAEANYLKPQARIVAYAEAEQDPVFFTTTPVLAVQKILQKTGISLEEIDFFEINEAFSVVPLAFIKLLNIPVEKVNVYGGAVSLGHPLGASGARIITTLLNVLKENKGRYGLAAICNGGGGASAMIIERI